MVQPAAGQSAYTAPSTPLGSTSTVQTATLTISATGTFTGINVLTQGFAGLDYQVASGGTCTAGTTYSSTGATCTVNYTFSPTAPGARMGGITLTTLSGTVMAYAYIQGIGTGPLATVIPGTISSVAGSGTFGYNGDNIAATAAQLGNPQGVAIDPAGNLYIADSANHRIRKVSASSGLITTVAGTGTIGFSGDGGPGIVAQLNVPYGPVLDGLGNLYWADQNNSRIRKLNLITGIISTAAGGGTGANNVPATSAQLHQPAGVAVDGAGNLYIADTFVEQVRFVNAQTGILTTIAGSTQGFGGDGGLATLAKISPIQGIAVDFQGNLYIADNNNHRIRYVDASTHIITTIAGAGTGGFSGDGGPATSAQLNSPQAVALDAAGNLYIADYGNARTRKIDRASGNISTVAGNGVNNGAALDGGPATAAVARCWHVSVDSAGNLYLSDGGHQLIRKVTATGAARTFPSTAVNAASTALTLTLASIGTDPLVLAAPSSGTNPAVNGPYALSGTCPQISPSGSDQTLAAGNSCTLVITFKPTAVSATNPGSVTTTDNSGNIAGATQSVAFSGPSTGTSTATSLAMSPSSGVIAGQTVTLTATVTPTAATGSVMFYDNGVAISGAQTPVAGSSTFAVTNIAAGAHSFSATFSGTGAYGASTSAAQNLNVQQAQQTITFGALANVTYSAATISLSATASSGLSVTFTSNPPAVCTVAGNSVTLVAAGSCSITASQSGGNGYPAATPVTQTFTILPAQLTPAITASNKNYDATAAAILTSQALSGIVRNDNVTLTVGAAAFSDKNAGTGKTVTATGLTLGGSAAGNYTLSSTSATTTASITAKSLTISATGVNKTYDATTAATVTLGDNRIAGDVLSESYTSAVFTDPNAGNGKTVNVSGISISGADSGNYSLSATTATTSANITPLAASVTPNAASKTYGSGDPSPLTTGTLTGFLAADNVAATYSRTAGEAVAGSPYTISATLSPAGVLGNYNITYNTANFAINQASSTVTVTCPNTPVTYNGAAQSPCTATATGAGNFSQSLTVNYTSNTNAGTAGANASFAGDANHTGSTGAWSFTIAPAPVTATAGSYSGAYDSNTHTISACVVAGTFTGALTCANSPASAGPDAGSGAVTPAAGGDTLTNFTITVAPGSWTIAPAASTVTVTCPTSGIIYNGSAQTPCSAAATGVGGLNATLAPSYTNNTNAGTAGASASFTGDKNHTASTGAGSFPIGQATSTVTVTCPASGITYNGAAQTPCSAAATGAGGLNASLTPTYTNNTNAGTAGASASFAGDANHTGSTGSGSFTIGPAASSVAVTCPATAVIYNGAAQAPCAAFAAGAGGLNQALTVSYTANTNAGPALASATFAGDANHTGSSGSGSFTIGAAPVTVTGGSYSGTYDANTHAISACKVTGTYTGTLTCVNSPASAGPEAGSGAVTPSAGGDTLSNFSITVAPGSWSIGQAGSAVTVTCPTAALIYNGTAQTPCTAAATGIGGLNQTLSVSYTNNTNAGAAGASASFTGDKNHTASSGSGSFTIAQAASSVTVSCPASLAYTGSALTPCTAAATGADGLNQPLSIAYTGNTNVGAAGASASYGGDANHTGSSGSGGFAITQAPSTVTVTCPATALVYNGAAQTPCTAAVTGAGGLNATLTASYTTNTNAGTAGASASYAGDANHSAGAGSASFTIAAAPVTAAAGSYSGVYDANTHALSACSVTGAYTGKLTCANSPASVGPGAGSGAVTVTLSGDTVSNFNVTVAPGSWSIAQAGSSVTVTCPASVVYNSTAQTPCTAVVTGVGGLNQSLSVTYSSNTNAGTAGASAVFAGDKDHTGSSGSASFTITKAPASVSLSNLVQAYDGGPKSVTAVASPLYCGPVGVTYNGSATAPSAVGSYAVVASVGNANCTGPNAGGTLIVYAYLSGGGSFVIGDKSAAIAGTQTFWGAQWAKTNSLSGGSAPNSFKGFADHTTPAAPACGGAFTVSTGGSPDPPATLPAFLGVAVSSSVNQSGATITGNIQQIVVIQTAPGYGPDPSTPGTGTIVATVCHQ